MLALSTNTFKWAQATQAESGEKGLVAGLKPEPVNKLNQNLLLE